MTPELAGAAIALSAVLAVSARGAIRRERTLARVIEPRTPEREPARGEVVRRWRDERPSHRGSPPPVSERTDVLVAASVAGALAGYRLAGPVGAIAGLVAGAVAVRMVARVRAERERVLAERQLGEFIDAVAAAVRAGLSVRRALVDASRDVDPPLRPALDAVRGALDVGEPLERAFERLAPAVGSRDARLVAALLWVHARTGGDLPRLLDDVAEIVRQRMEGLRSLRALTAQGRASGAVLAVLPVAFVALLSWTSGDGLGAFYRTPLGAALLSGGLVCEGLGFLWIRRIVDAPAREA